MTQVGLDKVTKTVLVDMGVNINQMVSVVRLCNILRSYKIHHSVSN